MSAVEKLISPQEYLEFERASPVKHEFYAGRMYAMAGASRNHNRITLNTAAALLAEIGDGPCDVYSSDMRVKLGDLGAYAYPDVVVACGHQEFEDSQQDTLLNPRVIIEVLSPSTEAYDRGEKFRRSHRLKSMSSSRRTPTGWSASAGERMAAGRRPRPRVLTPRLRCRPSVAGSN